MSVLNDLIYADKGCGTVVRGDLDFVVSDVDQALDCFELAVSELDCSARWSITMVVSVGHLTDCALWHSSDLRPGVHDCRYVPDALGVLVLALEFGRLRRRGSNRVGIRCYPCCCWPRCSQRSLEEDVLFVGGGLLPPGTLLWSAELKLVASLSSWLSASAARIR